MDATGSLLVAGAKKWHWLDKKGGSSIQMRGSKEHGKVLQENEVEHEEDCLGTVRNGDPWKNIERHAMIGVERENRNHIRVMDSLHGNQGGGGGNPKLGQDVVREVTNSKEGGTNQNTTVERQDVDAIGDVLGVTDLEDPDCDYVLEALNLRDKEDDYDGKGSVVEAIIKTILKKEGDAYDIKKIDRFRMDLMKLVESYHQQQEDGGNSDQMTNQCKHQQLEAKLVSKPIQEESAVQGACNENRVLEVDGGDQEDDTPSKQMDHLVIEQKEDTDPKMGLGKMKLLSTDLEKTKLDGSKGQWRALFGTKAG